MISEIELLSEGMEVDGMLRISSHNEICALNFQVQFVASQLYE